MKRTLVVVWPVCQTEKKQRQTEERKNVTLPNMGAGAEQNETWKQIQ